ncbi:hypothetical protein NG791_22360 [Laspinema sp. D1]|uniref:hypothetical protein n=1 Tax=Laspinema palackyanum TaxID=3231601 RepID=UPI0034953861|nr:hypothetical protein [Laspinema sp. D2b]
MEEQNLGESAALVQILREFFEGSQKNPELESLNSERVQLHQGMTGVEAVLSSGPGGTGRNSMPVMSEPIKPKALTTLELTKRLKVKPGGGYVKN